MLSAAWLWLPIGVLSLQFSTSVWKKNRNGDHPSFSELLLCGSAGYLAWTFGGELWSGDSILQAAIVALWWSAATPLLAFFWYGYGGRLRRGILRTIGALLTFTVVTLGSTLLLELEAGLAASAGGIAAFFFLTAPTLGRRWKRWRQQAQWKRTERQSQHQAERTQRRDEQATDAIERRAEQAERQLRQAEGKISNLRDQEAKRARSLKQRRADTIAQVKQARTWEREQLRQSGAGMAVHPSSFGYILLEAGRVLRHEIATGERIPALENDQFLLEVAERLLAADDFQERYLHQAGANVAAALQRHFQGEMPLAVVRAEVQKCALNPDQLAPTLVLEGPLLEAWLVPYRRFQELQRQLYAKKRHSHQAFISDFLRSRCSGVPETEQWQTFFDDSPDVFTTGKTKDKSLQKLFQPHRPLAPSDTSADRARRWISGWSWGRRKKGNSSDSNPESVTPTSTAPASPDPERPAGSNT